MRSPRCSTATTAASRANGSPTCIGGRENLEAIDFLKRMNELVYGHHEGVMTVAEESTAWPMVSRPTYLGGLGFGYKWNMGWMHDTLRYIAKEPVHRSYHHNQLTFGLLYAFTENFILPISHDEVVHGKGSMLDKMPGDSWQKFANLRAYYAFMWTMSGQEAAVHGRRIRPGRRVEPSTQSLDWHLLDDPLHAGVHGAGARPQRPLPRRNRRCTRPTASPRASAGSTATTPTTASSPISARRRTRRISSSSSATSRPVVREGYRIGVPRRRRLRRNRSTPMPPVTPAAAGNVGRADAADFASHGCPHSLAHGLPPLGALVSTVAAGAVRSDRCADRRSPREAQPATPETGEPAPSVTKAAADVASPGSPSPLGATWDGRGVNFALFSANAEQVELCLFDNEGSARDRANRAARVHRSTSGTAICRGPAPGLLYGYRVHGPYDAAGGPSLQPQQAADRSVRHGARRLMRARMTCISATGAAMRTAIFRSTARQRRARAEMPCRRTGVHLGIGAPAEHPLVGRPVIYELHVKRLHHAHPADPGTAARNLRRAGFAQPVIEHLHAARRHRRRVAADPADRRRAAPGDQGLRNYWGYNSINFFALEPRYLSRGASARIQAHGRAACTPPASRSSSTSSSTTPAKATSWVRRCRFAASTTPPTTASPTTATLSRLHRLRKLAQRLASARAADGDGFPALLGAGNARRRLSLRSRDDAGARSSIIFDPSAAFSTPIQQDPVLSQGRS